MIDLGPLGSLETFVMQQVWAWSPATARDVYARQKGRGARAYTTIMTTLDRLHKKGLLARTKEGLAWVYVPTKTREEFERAQADDLAARMLREHGEVGLVAFVDAAAADAVLERLELLIKERRRK